MAREPMSRSGAMPQYVWDIIETSRVGPVTDHPELMFLTIAGPARCCATSALPPGNDARDEASNRFCNTVTHSGDD